MTYTDGFRLMSMPPIARYVIRHSDGSYYGGHNYCQKVVELQKAKRYKKKRQATTLIDFHGFDAKVLQLHEVG